MITIDTSTIKHQGLFATQTDPDVYPLKGSRFLKNYKQQLLNYF